MIIPGWMQATLVSYYGEKPAELESFILSCQNKILETIGASFLPYELEQVHGTIVGLEGHRFANKIKNANFESHLSQTRLVDPAEFLKFVQLTQLDSIEVNIGGYSIELQDFTSRGQLPFKRSFSIQNNVVVVMGWPSAAANGHRLLDEYRRKFNRVNVLHKWHRTPSEIDDDFYLVLGRVQRIKDEGKERLVDVMREYLSARAFTKVTLGRKNLSIIGYLDPQLPRSTSCIYSLLDNNLTSDQFLTLYPKD